MAGASGKYRFDQRLGGGGMAEVFAGSTIGAEGFTRRVAIKRVLPGYSENPQFAQMFVAEAQISSRLIHPNIVSVLDFDRDDHQALFLVMELVEGRDLDQLASTGRLPYSVIIYVLTEALRGLGYAHDLPVGTGIRGVVHRDVSPHNVLLSWEGAVKVSDFGIAKARAASEATASVFIKGKPAYMSPEQANGQALDGRSDLFAIGVMLWEMLVGQRLFTGEDTRATLAAVLFGTIPRPRQLRADVPKDLEKIVMKLLERDLPARYPNAEAAIYDLERCADAKGGRDALIETLHERFAQQAPVRQNRTRSGASSPAKQAGGNASMAPTIVGHARPAAATIGSPRRGNPGARWAVIILAVAVVAVVTIAITAGGGKKNQPAAVVPQIDAPVVVHDAPPIVIDAAPPPADAAVADAPRKDATIPSVVHPATHAMGHLHVEGEPIRTVYIDGKRIRDMPVDVDLTVGKHTLVLTTTDDNKVEHKTLTKPIEIRADQPLVLTL